MTPITLRLLRDLFDRLLPGPTWKPWLRCAAVLFGLAYDLTPEDRAFILDQLGRKTLPRAGVREAWLKVGRRGGKSRFAALLAIVLAVFVDHSSVLVPGERGVIMLIAGDRRQARVLMRYILAFVDLVPPVKAKVTRQTQESIDFDNHITIEIHTASFRAVRGYTIVAAICDEICFWPSEDAANPDTEILHALRPAMATTNGLLLCISSPHGRRGEMWRAYTTHFGKDDTDRVVVWSAPSLVMNPSLDPQVVADAYADDPAVAAAEYGAEFRSDIETIFSRETLTDATVSGQEECLPVEGTTYVAFVDPSGGSSDSMTLATAHREANGRAVLDVVRERRPPFSPENVVAEYAGLMSRYNVETVEGDRYAGEWPREAFRRYGIEYRTAKRVKTEIYQELLPLLNAGKIRLLDHPRLTSQLASLERRTSRGGRDSIDHPPSGHDDVANSAAGALLMVGTSLNVPALPESFRTCLREVNVTSFYHGQCFLYGGYFCPTSPDGSCLSCEGFRAVKDARASHRQATGVSVDLRSFYKLHMRANRHIGMQQLRDQFKRSGMI